MATNALPTAKGDRCAFPRNLTRGTYGGDVNCLQQYLAAQGHLAEDEPSGFFDAQTEAALSRWQEKEGLGEGAVFGLPARSHYAKKHSLPAPDSNRVFLDGAPGDVEGRTCVDVCAEFAGQQDCQTRCVRAVADKKFACREACQVAFSTACDRAFPPSVEGGSDNYQTCLRYLDASCSDSCAAFTPR